MAGSRLLADLTPLRRFPQFRLLWAGYLVSTLGSQLTVVAVPYELFRLTRSSLDVGLLSLAQLGPLLVCSLLGGSVADAVDRRHLLVVTQSLLTLTSAGLALNAMSDHPARWPLFALTSAAAGISGLDSPARTAAVSTIVDPRSFASAFALWQLLMQVGVVVGPGLAGVLIGAVGVAPIYWIDAASFLAGIAAVVALEPLPVHGARTRAGLRSVAEGFHFLRGQRVLQAGFVADVDAMVFGMPRALFPALGLERFHGGASVVGLLYAAPGAGALIAALTTGWVMRVRRQGRAVILAIAVWGISITLFGLSGAVLPALALLAVAGGADVISAVFRNTILQSATPEELRGRLSAVHLAVVAGGPRLGDLESGAVATLSTPGISVVSGGLACLAGIALLAWRAPAFRHFAPAVQHGSGASAPPGASDPPG